ncbi:MAG: glycosyl transferase [Sphingobacteriia bacterium]|nr:MAG: glycosyl transferase [Sphingobacteriia bacterium]
MKLAYFILAHNAPEQLSRLLEKLQLPDAKIFIHLDLKAGIKSFEHLQVSHKNIIFLPDRVNINWAGYTMLEATFLGMDYIVKHFPEFDFVHLLSAADYPIKPVCEFSSFLSQNLGKSFLEWRYVYGDWEEAIPRIEKYHLVDYPFIGNYRIQTSINYLFPKRKMPMGYLAVGRSQWMTLSKMHVKYLLAFLQEFPVWKRFMKLTWGPDEFMIHTILYNSCHRDELVNDNLRYVDWSSGLKNPKTLMADDLPLLLDSKKYFARKFDPVQSQFLLNHLDQIV